MEMLLQKEMNGGVLAGSDALLRERALQGDDITLFVESYPYSEFIVFQNLLVTKSAVNGLSLKHLAHGIGSIDAGNPVELVQYIYNSINQVAYCRETVNTDVTLNNVIEFNPSYASYTWYSTRRYAPSENDERTVLRQTGDAAKMKFELWEDFHLIIKPDILYFPIESEGGGTVIKSAQFLLPSEFASNPSKFITEGREIKDAKSFSSVFLQYKTDAGMKMVLRPEYPLNSKPAAPSIARRVMKKLGRILSPNYVRIPSVNPCITRLETDPEVLVPLDLGTIHSSQESEMLPLVKV